MNLKNNASVVLAAKVTSNKQPDVDLRPAGIDVAQTGGDCTRCGHLPLDSGRSANIKKILVTVTCWGAVRAAKALTAPSQRSYTNNPTSQS